MAMEDTYKSKLLRRSLPPEVYDVRLGSVLSRVLAPIGASDNEIGGLDPSEDPLPAEVEINPWQS